MLHMDNKHLIEMACSRFGNDARRMMDILWEIQDKCGWISTQAMQAVAHQTGTYRVEVEGVASFYSFFKTSPQGHFIIHLCEDIIDRHAGMAKVQNAFEEALGIKTGETTADGMFSLHLTPSIGMCDQAPAALINHQVITKLSANKAKTLIRHLKKAYIEDNLPDNSANVFSHVIHQALKQNSGDGNNSHPLVNAMVNNNIKLSGKILLGDINANAGLIKAFSLRPAEIIKQVREANFRGRGGAGYVTAKKWQLAADTEAEQRYVMCNADEGEPGTFKDRVLLTERAELLFEGMTIVAYAIGSEQGILYLRAEYRYLQPYLENILTQRREAGLLGKDILIDDTEKTRFSFDIRIQLGAGAYICGEESSLINSCEGKRGEPQNKPPFPSESGYLGYPTIVNNVESFCNIPRIIENGADWFKTFGTPESSGTKLLSICGDCAQPGVYECEMGITVNEALTLAGAKDAEAVQVGGASGIMIARDDFGRRLCFEDLPTAGAVMIFAKHRNILDIVHYFMHFFIEESCGYCTPCRVGNVFIQQGLEKIMQGLGEVSDLDYLQKLGKTIIQTSRCGLGHTSPRPVLSSIKNFPLVYAALLKEHDDGRQAGFNIQHALDESRIIAKRRSLVYDPVYGSEPNNKQPNDKQSGDKR